MANRPRYSGDIADIVELCGEAVAHEVVERIGGVSVRIPLGDVPADHLLMRLSKDARAAMLEAFGGAERLYIPRTLEDHIEKESKKAEALRLLNEGMTPTQTALEVGVTERTIYKWMKGKRVGRKPDPRQIEMF